MGFIRTASPIIDAWQAFAIGTAASVAFVNAAILTSFPAGATSQALPATSLTAGNTVLVITGAGASVNSITDTAGNTYTLLWNLTQGSFEWSNCSVWYVLNAIGNASNVITVNYSSSTQSAIASVQYSGVGSIDSVHAEGHNSPAGATTLTSGSFTPSLANETAVALSVMASNAETFTAGTGYTLQSPSSGSAVSCVETDSGIPVSSQTASLTTGAADNSTMAVVLLQPTNSSVSVIGGGLYQRWRPYTDAVAPATASPVVVPKDPVPPMLPERFARTVWNPEKTDVKSLPFPGLVIVAGVPIPPMLPDRFIRSVWNPERSWNDYPVVKSFTPAPQVSVAIDKQTVEINELFHVTATFTSLAVDGVSVPLIIKNVVPIGSPTTCAFSFPFTADVAGFGFMLVGVQSIVILSAGTRAFFFDGVCFLPGRYSVTVHVIDQFGNIFMPSSPANITVTYPT